MSRRMLSPKGTDDSRSNSSSGSNAYRVHRVRAARSRGAVMVEYALLLVAVGIPAVAGLTASGAHMFKNYREARNQMLSAFP